jgi:hypothetical protein
MPSLVVVACFLPGRAKDISAPPRTYYKSINVMNEISSYMKMEVLQNVIYIKNGYLKKLYLKLQKLLSSIIKRR